MHSKSIAVIGAVSAGVKSLCHFLYYLPSDWKVFSIHDPNISITGIGESTNPTFMQAVQNGANFEVAYDMEKLDATLKFGTEYVGWRENSFVNPFLSGSVSLHMDTFSLKNFIFPRLKEVWGEKFEEIQGNVTETKDHGDFVKCYVDKKEYKFDYVIDCSGFPKEKDNIVYDIPVNYAIVCDLPIKNSGCDGRYTTHLATENGWAFVIPLLSRTSYGYLFNDEITSIENATKDLQNIIKNPDVEIKHFSIKSFYSNNFFDGRIFKNGNKVLFFEPLFSNSLWIYDRINRFIFDKIIDNISDENITAMYHKDISNLIDVISYHYHGGSVYDSDFWNYAQRISTDRLANSESFKDIVPKIIQAKKENIFPQDLSWVFHSKSLTILDKNFDYGYFNELEGDQE
jgi:tryptophan halogenase